MREFTFGVEYDRGADPVMDAFDAHTALVGHSIDAPLTARSFWRIERFAGPQSVLDDIELRYERDGAAGEGVTGQFEATGRGDVLERTAEELVRYSYVSDVSVGETVQTVAGKHLADGVVLESRRRDATRWWRVLLRSDARVGVFYDDLSARLRDGLAFRMGHVGDANGWQRDALSSVSMPEAQEVALRTATEAGYYETPRRVTLDEIADDLDVPRSTLSYRLRRAEIRLVERYVDAGGDRWGDDPMSARN